MYFLLRNIICHVTLLTQVLCLCIVTEVTGGVDMGVLNFSYKYRANVFLCKYTVHCMYMHVYIVCYMYMEIHVHSTLAKKVHN